MFRTIPLSFLVLLAGCATGVPVGSHAQLRSERLAPFAPPEPPRLIEPPTTSARGHGAEGPKIARETVLSAARSLVGHRQVALGGRRFPSDCSGLVLAAYADAGVNLLELARPDDNAVTALYRYARERGRVYQGGWPVAGDLVFFKETYDQNRDGRPNDGLTHVGLVEGVDPDGTIRVIHHVRRGVVVTRMNLRHPDLRSHPGTGRRLNDYLRSASGSRPAALTGQLFVAYATLLPAK